MTKLKPVAYALLMLTSLFVTIGSETASAYDILGKSDSYLGIRRFQLFTGVSYAGLINTKSVVSGGVGPGFRIGAGYSLTRRLRLDFYYNLNSFDIKSPNPLAAGQVRSQLWFHSEIWRLLYRYDRGMIYPYGSIGLGFYQLTSVNSQTGLSFPANLQMPVALGLETYVLRDVLSLNLEYTYHFIFNENQNSGVLSLLNVDEVRFNIHSLNLALVWHLF